MMTDREFAKDTVAMAWGNFAFVRSPGRDHPLVLLHPLALSARIWELTFHELSSDRDIIAIDLRGHGDSGWNGKAFSVSDLADDVADLLDKLDIQRCDIAGMSMGGCVAMTLAAANPDRVRRAVLCDTTAWYGPEAKSAWEERAQSAEQRSREDLIPFQIQRWFSDDFRARHPADVQRVVDIFVRTNRDVHAQACRALGAFDARAIISSIKSSTLVVTGEEDYATPEAMGKYLAQGIPGATFRRWRGVRHFAVLESPDLRRFIASYLSEEGWRR